MPSIDVKMMRTRTFRRKKRDFDKLTICIKYAFAAVLGLSVIPWAVTIVFSYYILPRWLCRALEKAEGPFKHLADVLWNWGHELEEASCEVKTIKFDE